MSVNGKSGTPPGQLRRVLQEHALNFVFESLALWRDLPNRAPKQAEEALNAQFSKFLTANAISLELPYFFHHEQPQDVKGVARKIDLAAVPNFLTAAKLLISTTDDVIVVVEAKRLPAPRVNRRIEYVTGAHKLSGGIQRFKALKHGVGCSVAGIVGYIQKHDSHYFFGEINSWILGLCVSPCDGLEWAESEVLKNIAILPNKTARCISSHKCCDGKQIILHHLWVEM